MISPNETTTMAERAKEAVKTDPSLKHFRRFGDIDTFAAGAAWASAELEELCAGWRVTANQEAAARVAELEKPMTDEECESACSTYDDGWHLTLQQAAIDDLAQQFVDESRRDMQIAFNAVIERRKAGDK